MSDNDFGFAPPPFNPESALALLRRSLRDLTLTARGDSFEWRGKRAVELTLQDGALHVRLARKLSTNPEWDRMRVANGHDQRKLLDDVKKRLARWDSDD